MTADIRTAAQREAEATWPKYPSGEGAAQIDTDRHLKRKAFRKGAAWAAARVTPTREQIAEVVAAALERWLTVDDRHDARDRETVVADAVLALMQGLAEGEGDGRRSDDLLRTRPE